MNTIQTYYTQTYLAELDATIISVDTKGPNAQVQLSATVFYPQSGGQPADVGEITGPNGKLRVEMVVFKDGGIIQIGKLVGSLKPGDAVRLQIIWSHRHHAMRNHTAGHALHEAVLSLTDKMVPVKANHGSNCYLEYAGEFPVGVLEEVEACVNALVAQDLPVFMRESSLDEIKAKCRFVLPGLPTNKPLRTVQIGDGQLVPCGGVHVRRLGEIGRVVLGDVKPDPKSGNTVVKYRITITKAEDPAPVVSAAEAMCLGSPS
jgi:Ser-tRNA(Ala) deacylase AlaX